MKLTPNEQDRVLTAMLTLTETLINRYDRMSTLSGIRVAFWSQRELVRGNDITLSQMAAAGEMSKSTLHALLKRRPFVEYRNDPDDDRRKLVSFTDLPKRLKYLAKIMAGFRRLQNTQGIVRPDTLKCPYCQSRET